LVHHFLQDDNALHTNHLLISRWLQIAPKTRVWRTIILRTLTIVLQKENETLSLAAKVVSALALSGDAGVSVYFRQLLKSSHPNLRQLAALGCGILRDKNAIEELALIFQEQSPASIRSASLALAAIGEKRALEILASALLSGDETTRRYAAEALANNSSEGHPALKEASGMEDLLVRRAVVYGLIRINRPWAYKIVENLQLEDTEWVVRNAAIEAFDELKHKSTYVPTFEIDLTETPWLVDYANRIGTTVAPGKLAEQLVAKALSNGNKDEKLFAMEYYRNMCTPENIDQIYAIYSNSSGELKDMAYHILWLGLLTGIRLPTAIEF